MAAADDGGAKEANGATAGTGMYRQRRFYEPTDDMELPKSMYKLESFRGRNDERPNGQAPTGNAATSLIEDLEKRQERILSEIKKLQDQVQSLVKDQGVKLTAEPSKVAPSKMVSSICHSQAPPPLAAVNSGKAVGSSLKSAMANLAKDKTVEDLVISASPSKPPLSLLVLQHLVSKNFATFSSSYLHSSAKSSNATQLRDILCSSNSLPSNRNAYQYAITFIWKEEKYSPTLKVSLSQQTPIIGECNVARYLARLLSPSYDSGDALNSTRIDALIDLADGQLSNDASQKGNFLKTIGAQLGKSQWMLGNDLTLADIVLWSAVHQSKQVSKAPDSIRRWIDQCNQHPVFATVKQLI